MKMSGAKTAPLIKNILNITTMATIQTYQPRPIDTNDVQLPEELQGLIEKMSENVHDVWAEGRISQGWTYGPVRDDHTKQHPCLVPYSELPEVEKEYDRNTSIGTLKLILKLGFRIESKREL